jgi:hypothetical protein
MMFKDLMHNKEIVPSYKLILIAMAQLIESEAILDYRTICGAAGIGRTLLTEALAYFEDQGIIKIINEQGNSDTYRLYGLPDSNGNKMSQHDRIATMFELEQSFNRSAKYPDEKLEEREKRIKQLMAKEDRLKFQEKYDAMYLKLCGTKSSRWGGKQRGQMDNIIKMFRGDVYKAMDFIEYIFINWKDLLKYWKMASDTKPNLSIILTYGKGQIPKVAKEYEWESTITRIKETKQKKLLGNAMAPVKTEHDD